MRGGISALPIYRNDFLESTCDDLPEIYSCSQCAVSTIYRRFILLMVHCNYCHEETRVVDIKN